MPAAMVHTAEYVVMMLKLLTDYFDGIYDDEDAGGMDIEMDSSPRWIVEGEEEVVFDGIAVRGVTMRSAPDMTEGPRGAKLFDAALMGERAMLAMLEKRAAEFVVRDHAVLPGWPSIRGALEFVLDQAGDYQSVVDFITPLLDAVVEKGSASAAFAAAASAAGGRGKRKRRQTAAAAARN